MTYQDLRENEVLRWIGKLLIDAAPPWIHVDAAVLENPLTVLVVVSMPRSTESRTYQVIVKEGAAEGQGDGG